MTRLFKYALLTVLIGLLTGCASLQSTRAPDADLSRIKTIHVQKLEGEDADIDLLIAKRLTALGYQVTTSAAARPDHEVDATLTYVDRWMWDITMYLLRLTITLRDGREDTILAVGESYRPSLQRRSPEVMVEEVLDDIFQRKAEAK
ncbi:MAG: hypothetical protein CVU19_16930 [Betaproteobacteria bacterium HGW-Betaproteobacteria-13]|jgi:hypothetical protein|uniref:DUF4136 domain-containing protein n=1 Tax=Parazoarcus communis TaxID=41977 RepID=A0A2U8H0E1_9RHOO|nr:hypothetical protein [Parazoarcus communis]AWI79080.1 hypothetical protein CEW87_06705 [Parazoarcus communis]PKO79608.1 MAG: hypothetical protein CVU19_16930 [Betaproteobacteria bacterium HGW-Betaproteobacteria-13]